MCVLFITVNADVKLHLFIIIIILVLQDRTGLQNQANDGWSLCFGVIPAFFLY